MVGDDAVEVAVMERHDRAGGVERLRRFEVLEPPLDEAGSSRRARVDADRVEPTLGQPLDERAVPAADVQDPRASRQALEDERVEAAPPAIVDSAHSAAPPKPISLPSASR